MDIKKSYLIIWLFAFLYFCWGMQRFGLVIDTDDWGILFNSRRLLEGHIAGDPNKTISVLMGMLAVLFDEPWVFPIISSMFGAGACLGVYRIIESITRNHSVALLGWAIVLNSPVLLWQVLSCNSISFMTCFLIWALHYFISQNYMKGSLMLSLASMARPEPILIALFLSWFMILKGREGILSWRSVITFLLILGFPPLWWMGFNEVAYGRLFYSLERVHQGGQILIASMNPGDFLVQFWRILKTYYLSEFAAVFSIFGIILLFGDRKKMYFLYVFFFVSFFGLWAFVGLKFALIERFLLPFYIYLMIFGVVLFDRVLGKLKENLSSEGLKNFCSISLFLVFFLSIIPSQASARILGILHYHSSFDRDLPTVVRYLKQEVTSESSITVLVSARRIPFLLYYLYDERDKISFVSFRKIYQNQTDWNRHKVDFIILAPGDMFPPKSALYNLDLLSADGLARQGLEIAGNIKVSPLTRILKLVQEKKSS